MSNMLKGRFVIFRLSEIESDTEMVTPRKEVVIAKKAKKIQSGFIFDYTFIIITGFTLFISIIFYVSVS